MWGRKRGSGGRAALAHMDGATKLWMLPLEASEVIKTANTPDSVAFRRWRHVSTTTV